MPKLPQVQHDFIPFKGGLDLETPSWSTKPGTLRESQNYEIGINGGYDRLTGYERYDGQAKPSAAAYSIWDDSLITISGTINVGDTVTGATSTETAVVIARPTGAVVVTKVSGTFQAEDLTVSGVQATITGPPVQDAAATALLHAQYLNLAADEYRGDIGAVGGANSTGSVLGLWLYNDVVYAWRNNVGETEAELWKSSASGWTQVALGFELSFTSGGGDPSGYEIEEGDTITGATSGATAVVTRVVTESGVWSGTGGDTAAGRLIFASQTGTFQAENLDVGANLNVATIAADSDAITLLPDGRFEMITHNFGGTANAARIYGCDGVNRGWEFDGTVFVPIATGTSDASGNIDTPLHVAAHKNHLFFSFRGSAQHSSTGNPYVWDPITGAAELAVGDTITGFQSQPGSEGNAALAIYSSDRVNILYGTSVSDWQLATYREEIGAFPYTIQDMGLTLMLDDRGLAFMQTSQNFGNFQHATLSRLIQTYVNSRKTQAVDSCIVRDKSQYRLFFTGGESLYVTLEGQNVVGMMPQVLGHNVKVVFSREDSSGEEVIMFGDDAGYVFQMEKGTSFDGDSIEAYLVLHYHHAKTPRIIKGYKGCTLEVGGDGYADFEFTYELDYTSIEKEQPGTETKVLAFAATRWDSFVWDAFYWDGQVLSPSRLEMQGSGENVSLIIRSNSDYHVPTNFSGALIRFIMRRMMR